MKKIIYQSLSVLLLTSCANDNNSVTNSTDKNNSPIEMEANYPWLKEVTKSAIAGIHKSIKNMSLPPDQRETNFPSDPMGMAFSITEIIKFEIVGYETSSAQNDIINISFQPSDEIISSPSVVVEINTTTCKVIRVYMSPDA